MLFPKAASYRTTAQFSTILSCLISRGLAGTWIYPEPNTNHIFNRTDTLNATWATTFDAPSMALWCQSGNESVSAAEFNVSVPGTGSYLVDLSKFGNKALECHLEVTAVQTEFATLSGPNFHINDLESNPPTIWSLPDASDTTSASPKSSFYPTGSMLPETTDSITLSSTSATPTGNGRVTVPVAQPAVSSPAPVQESNTSSGLSVGAAVGITLGVVIIVITLITTFWYVRRSHQTSNVDQLEDLAAVKAAELESARAVAERNNMHVKNNKTSYPVSVGKNSPPPVQELDGRPYWGRPF